MSNSTLKVGDIISSPEFAFGRRDYVSSGKKAIINVGGKDKNHIVTEINDEETRVEHAAQTGVILPKHHRVNYGAYDRSRGQAKFVIERAEMEGGSTGGGMNGHDDWPDALHVIARRLMPDGRYSPSGELIKFVYDTNCYINAIAHVTIHGNMNISFR